MTQTHRDRTRETTREELKAAALRQIAENGVPAFSLRAVAREMGLTAPALYRYFKDREALLGALIVDAFTSFGDSLEKALESRPAADHFGRMMAICAAYRGWAIANPQRYGLLFGTPVPHARPAPEIHDTGQRSFGVLLRALAAAHAAGALRTPPAMDGPSPLLARRLKALRVNDVLPYPATVIRQALTTWSWIHGLVSLELCGQLPGFLGDATGELIEAEAASHLRAIGMAPWKGAHA
jgi:AcrR family transcriptional regulator